MWHAFGLHPRQSGIHLPPRERDSNLSACLCLAPGGSQLERVPSRRRSWPTCAPSRQVTSAQLSGALSSGRIRQARSPIRSGRRMLRASLSCGHQIGVLLAFSSLSVWPLQKSNLPAVRTLVFVVNYASTAFDGRPNLVELDYGRAFVCWNGVEAAQRQQARGATCTSWPRLAPSAT